MENFEQRQEKLARVMYTSYCKTVGDRSYTGEPLSHVDNFFKDRRTKVQANAWREIAGDALRDIPKGIY